VQSIAEVRYKLGNLKMDADQNPSILFYKLATVDHVYVHTKGRITDDDMIQTIAPYNELGGREPRSPPDAKPPKGRSGI